MSGRVLIIDDEEGMRYSLSVILSKNNYNTLAVENGQKAFDLLVDDPNFDFILCDLRMPEMDGLDFLEKASCLDLDSIIIMMSAYGTIDNAVEAMKRGAFDFISKPFKPDQILVVFNKAIERRDLQENNARLQREVEGRFAFSNIITKSPLMIKICDNARKIADYKTSVLLSGESGTGKELIARAIHYYSNRSKRPFVAINCGAIPENLLESELFGYVAGAFTDAVKDKIGLIGTSSKGTLFLDEIGELPLHLQVKLLRVLQEEEIRPLGATQNIKVDLRVIAATLLDLEHCVKKGLFREDLYYRLNIFPIHVPPLRDRSEDIPLLVDRFIAQISKRLGKKIKGIKGRALSLLMDYVWPGNVRELENVMERAVVLTEDGQIDVEEIPENIRKFTVRPATAIDQADLSIKRHGRIMEKDLILAALKRTGGNRTRAAKLLEISHRALLYKIQQYEIND